jgi:chromosome partitioning protein
MALTICVLNQKGGVGKTSTCHHLAGAFAKLKRRTLLIDMDPQSNLTQGYLGAEAGTSIPRETSVVRLFDSSGVFERKELIQPTAFEYISLVPGSVAMREHDFSRPAEGGFKQLVLRNFVAHVKDDFDVILFDCPPNVYLASWNAMCASDHIIVPLQPEDYGAQGIFLMKEAISAVQAGPNPGLKLLGYLITMRNTRLGLHTAFEEMLRKMYGPEVFTTAVPLAVAYKAAISFRAPIGFYKPRSQAARIMTQLAEEVLDRSAAGSGHEKAKREKAGAAQREVA